MIHDLFFGVQNVVCISTRQTALKSITYNFPSCKQSIKGTDFNEVSLMKFHTILGQRVEILLNQADSRHDSSRADKHSFHVLIQNLVVQ